MLESGEFSLFIYAERGWKAIWYKIGIDRKSWWERKNTGKDHISHHWNF